MVGILIFNALFGRRVSLTYGQKKTTNEGGLCIAKVLEPIFNVWKTGSVREKTAVLVAYALFSWNRE